MLRIRTRELIGWEWMASGHAGGVGRELRRHFCSESGQVLEGVAQGGGGITVPGGV